METITDPSLYCDKLDWLWAPLSDLGFNILAPEMLQEKVLTDETFLKGKQR